MEEDEGGAVRLPQGDGNEANECREPTVINAGLGPTRLSLPLLPSMALFILPVCWNRTLATPRHLVSPRPFQQSSFSFSLSTISRRFARVSRFFSIAPERNCKLKKFDRWEVSDR